jgi:PAS domain S-box-containing protein
VTTSDRLVALEQDNALLRARLAAAEAQLRPVAESGVIGIVVWDGAGRVTDANDAFLWMVDRPRETLAGGELRLESVTPPEHAARQARALAELRRTGRTGIGRARLLRRDGTRVPVLVLGMIAIDDPATRWSAAVLPLIERESAADTLRETEARLAGVVASAMDAIVTVDAELNVVVFNAAAERMFGYAADAIIGRPIGTLVPTRFHASMADDWRRFASSDAAPRAVAPLRRLVALRADGTEFPIEATVSRADVAGRLLFTIILRDVTERLRNEEERTNLLERAEVARVEAESASRIKDEFLATLSHELRTPLTAMLTWTHLMRARRLDAANQVRAVETLERCTLAMGRMIDDLLDVSRIVAGKLVVDRGPVDPAAVARAAVESVRLTADEKGVVVDARLDAPPGFVMGDAGRLHQVLANLLSNAVKFTRRGGRVTLELVHAGGDVRFLVRDTGQGIDPEFLPYVFERFRQANRSTTRLHGGLGLGLSIVHHLVERHGGSVTAASEGLGRGATFTVTLPLSAAAGLAVEPVAEPGDELGEPLTGIRILLVDDHDDARRSVATALEHAGATVVAVESVAAALRALGRHAFDVLVSDIALPGEDGYALMRRLRTDPPPHASAEIVAAALTAYAGPEDRERVLEAGYDEHLAKPIAPAVLVRTIRELFDRRSDKRAGEPAATQGGHVDAAGSPSKPQGSNAAMARARPVRA